MSGLHRRNYRIFPEKAEIIFIHHLRMFDSPSSVVFSTQNLTINFKNRAVCGISDGMRAHLKIAVFQFFSQSSEMFLIAQQKSSPTFFVGIIVDETRSSGTKRTIGIHLESTNGDISVRIATFFSPFFIIIGIVFQQSENLHFQDILSL
ncbi:hypothetical protein SDC9_140179 [bioreactor metagenome]|uniref:Uncharacterized protein n=1 Tax=bioreactor metagenome TaxID=1076179 RepID=A0A645DWQ3_9ZZZZ